MIEVLPGLGKFFKELGYAVHFVSTARLDFLNQRTLLEKAGYENFIENGFNTQKRYVFDAAPDDALYAKTIELVKKQTSPYFITLQSISSHIPYNTPYGNSDKDMYRYVDESFAKFYEDLKQEGFFEDGILLVVSDHHKMLPIETQEFEMWGSEADAKIIAFMVGAGIEPEVDDNLYQQTDVFYSLRKEF